MDEASGSSPLRSTECQKILFLTLSTEIASIVQWIEQLTPNEQIQVQLLVGALYKNIIMSLRIEKMNSLIQFLMGEILKKECSFKPGVFVTVVKVDTTRDLRYARIFASVFPDTEKEYVFQTLLHEQIHLQKSLHKKLSIKILPKISFLLDETESHADTVERLFFEIRKEKEDR